MQLITMRRLGTNGQWGNQIFQYAFLRTYARRYGLEYQCPAWAGQALFGHEDPPVTCNLPVYYERRTEVSHGFGLQMPPEGDEAAGHDYVGYCQFDTAWYRPEQHFIQSLFSPVVSDELLRCKDALQQLRERGKTIIALHFRDGDSGRMIYFLTPFLWCLRWLHANWGRFPDPVLFIAAQNPERRIPFAAYKPVMADDLGIRFAYHAPRHYAFPYHPQPEMARSMDFFPDWFLLQHADVVLAAESTFSVSAAWVSRTVKEFWRPRLSLQDFERVDVWDTCVSPREHLNDYPGSPGTQAPAPHYAGTWGDWQSMIAAVPEDPATWKPYLEPA